MSQIKIAFVGKKATGKTFAAFYLHKHHKFKQMRMDEGVRKFIRYMYGYGHYRRPTWELTRDIYDDLYKRDPNIHVNYLLRKLERVTFNDVVVEDVRYISELQVLREQGFIIIRIVAPASRQKIHIAKSLREAAPGSLLLAEYFVQDGTAGYSADYVVLNDTRDNTRQALVRILDTLRANSV